MCDESLSSSQATKYATGIINPETVIIQNSAEKNSMLYRAITRIDRAGNHVTYMREYCAAQVVHGRPSAKIHLHKFETLADASRSQVVVRVEGRNHRCSMIILRHGRFISGTRIFRAGEILPDTPAVQSLVERHLAEAVVADAVAEVPAACDATKTAKAPKNDEGDS